MTGYIIRRIALMVPSFFIVLIVVFALINLGPGDRVALMADGSRSISKPDLDRARKELGLDKPLYQQFGIWLGGLITGNLGHSLVQGKPVSSMIKERAPVSLRLGFMALVIAWVIAIPLGILAAVKQDTWADYGVRSIAVLMLSVPNFWLATLVIVVPAAVFGVFIAPTYVPYSTDPWANIRFFVIPALVVGVYLTGATMRMTRAMVLEVLRADYIRTARAKGLGERVVIFRHALKNALIPVVTIVGSQTTVVIGGTVIIEQIFSVPGMGTMLLTAINTKDVAVVQAMVVFVAAFIMIMNLVVDLTYAWLDPRISYS